ncbi:MAG: polysaccharide pyruvyl transferase family protein [Dietzia sp.]
MTPTRRAAPASRLRRLARRRLDSVRAVADARWGPPREDDRPVYLVAPAGHPNHGDEQLLAGWLRFLRYRLPGTPVVVDCHTPGQAAVLHHAEHPDVVFTDTLWRLAGEHGAHAPIADSAASPSAAAIESCRRAVRDLGVRPELGSGLALLRRASVVHLVGGGYANDQWPHHLGVVAAAGEAGRLAGARVVATGQGFVPCGDARRLAEALREFDLVTVRDAASAELLAGTGVPVRLLADDGWLALGAAGPVEAGDHPVYSDDPDACRDLVLCAQSDLVDPVALADAVARVLAAWAVPGERITVVESIPGGDRVVWDRVCERAAATSRVASGSPAGAGPGEGDDDDEVGLALAALRLPRARFVPFLELWDTGLPVRPGQVWLTTRFHPHLFGAARGASGLTLRAGSDYYDVKHGSLADAGSPWPSLQVGASGVGAPPALESVRSVGGFDPGVVAQRVGTAEALAEEIYAR